MKKGQAWGFDLMIGAGIFMIGLTVFFLYTLNYPKGNEETGKDLEYEAKRIASDLLSSGLPTNWNEINVQKIGLTSNNLINQTKLDLFYNLMQNNYNNTKILFGTKYDYFVNASNSLNINGNPISGIGIYPINVKNEVKLTRVTVYEGVPINLEVTVWES